MDVIEETIIDYLKKNVGGNPRPTDSLALVGVDSVGMAELTFELEKRFSVRVEDEFMDLETISDLANYIRERRSTT
jgi:acyl carrier protein